MSKYEGTQRENPDSLLVFLIPDLFLPFAQMKRSSSPAHENHRILPIIKLL